MQRLRIDFPWRALRRPSGGGRAGLTLMEVLVALAVFMIGSVAIVGLFATASFFHADGTNRRMASYVAGDLLAQIRSLRYRDVFARTLLLDDADGGDVGGPVIGVDSVTAYRYPPPVLPDGDVPVWEPAAFDLYSPVSIFYPQHGQSNVRNSGPLLIENEWIWHTWTGSLPDPPMQFENCQRQLWGTSWPDPLNPGHHNPDDPNEEEGNYGPRHQVLQPRTWLYMLNSAAPSPAGIEIRVMGNPTAEPPDDPDTAGDAAGVPPSGFLSIDEEWFRYSSVQWDDVTSEWMFIIGDADGDGAVDRGLGGTGITGHAVPTPVTVAREYEFYPGFYYTVQFYPTNTTGHSAHAVIGVAYGTRQRTRVHTFRTVFSPRTF